MHRAVNHAAELGLETLQIAPQLGQNKWEEGIAFLMSTLEDVKTFIEEAPPDHRYMKTNVVLVHSGQGHSHAHNRPSVMHSKVDTDNVVMYRCSYCGNTSAALRKCGLHSCQVVRGCSLMTSDRFWMWKNAVRTLLDYCTR